VIAKIDKRWHRLTGDDIAVSAISYGFVSLFAIICVFPFFYVFCVSFMSYFEYLQYPLRIIPRSIDFGAYKEIMSFKLIRSGYFNTIFITVVGTALSISLMMLTAYPLSKKDLKGRGLMLGMITFTMFFGGGMIPNYILIRSLKLTNTLFALILPGCISAYNVILMKNFIRATIPVSLEEAAVMDGASPFKILVLIIVPLSLPAIATFIVFLAVGYWNEYFSAMIYCTSRNKWPLMVVLRELVIDSTAGGPGITAAISGAEAKPHPFTLKMAAIIFTTLPILVVYPFFQRYFIAGLFIGSVKE
jgi:putative aldouronate transport system permease protein